MIRRVVELLKEVFSRKSSKKSKKFVQLDANAIATILSFLEPKDIVSLGCISKRFSGICTTREVFEWRFGVPLHLTTPTVKVNRYKYEVPKVLIILKTAFEEISGSETVGVFRVSPPLNERKKVKQLLLNKHIIEPGTSVHCITTLVKLFFRELAPNLLNGLREDYILRLSDTSFEKMDSVLVDFPEPHLSVFLWLLDFLAEVSLKDEVNKMGVRNLATMLAPNLFTCDNPMTGMYLTANVVRLMNHMIQWRLSLLESGKLEAYEFYEEEEEEEEEEEKIHEIENIIKNTNEEIRVMSIRTNGTLGTVDEDTCETCTPVSCADAPINKVEIITEVSRDGVTSTRITIGQEEEHDKTERSRNSNVSEEDKELMEMANRRSAAPLPCPPPPPSSL